VNALVLAITLLGGAVDAPKTQLEGTILSIRGNIYVLRPSLRPKITRVLIGPKTEVMAYERTNAAVLKPGMRIAAGGRYAKETGLRVRWIEAAEKPIGHLKGKRTGIRTSPDGKWGNTGGTLKTVQPFVIRDDEGKEIKLTLSPDANIWHDFLVDRRNLLIGTRVFVSGTTAPDGVVQAESVAPNRDHSATGTMFGRILGVRGRTLVVQPRYTDDRIQVDLARNVTLQREIRLDPDTIKVGDRVTFWGEQRNRPYDQPRSDDLKAIALLVGPGMYPRSTGKGGGSVLRGRLTALEPDVRFRVDGGKTIKIVVPAQMITARLVPVRPSDVRAGSSAMLVLSRLPDGRFSASSVVLDASPWVGYGG